MLLQRSTIQLLRFPFSYFLMPVFWFALSCEVSVSWPRAILIFVLLHFLLYPSSNGYNSFMDRDEGSIGAIEKPLLPTKQLFYVVMVMDFLAAAVSFLITPLFALAIFIYIVSSRLYSYRGIRLKRFAILGYITVVINQGALTFAMVYYGAGQSESINLPWLECAAAAFLIGGFYPVTQVYQHEADAKDGVQTISMLLGIKGTFIFCAGMYTAAFGLLFMHYSYQHKLFYFIILQCFFIPVLIVFIQWLLQVWKDSKAADFKHTMKMNIVAATYTSLAFITLLILNQFG